MRIERIGGWSGSLRGRDAPSRASGEDWGNGSPGEWRRGGVPPVGFARWAGSRPDPESIRSIRQIRRIRIPLCVDASQAEGTLQGTEPSQRLSVSRGIGDRAEQSRCIQRSDSRRRSAGLSPASRHRPPAIIGLRQAKESRGGDVFSLNYDLRKTRGKSPYASGNPVRSAHR